MPETAAAGAEPGVLRVLTTKAETRAFYDKIAHVYDLLSEHTESPLKQEGLKLLAAKPGEKVLEIGFGTGHCLVDLAKAAGPSGRVYGIDLSDKMRDLAAANLAKQNLADRSELFCGDAAKLPLPDAGLDAVFMSFTLELFDLPEIPTVLAECRRVLKPGGRLAVVSVSKEGKDSLLVEAYEWTHKHFPNLMDCRPIFARRAIEQAGFEIKTSNIGHMWVPVEIVLARKA
ncbi:MAG: methyltransferase domain-containing protein [Planctomycetaceae bacterium]|nr:methyltransferase domain-containing protein [Planctomycetaceae bacterium]